MADSQPHIKAQPIHIQPAGQNPSNREVWAEVCYYYPQYTLKEASTLSARDIRLLLKTARRLKAGERWELVQIATAPHTEKGKGVKDLIQRYQEEMKN